MSGYIDRRTFVSAVDERKGKRLARKNLTIIINGIFLIGSGLIGWEAMKTRRDGAQLTKCESEMCSPIREREKTVNITDPMGYSNWIW
jgi:hypothetical protein